MSAAVDTPLRVLSLAPTSFFNDYGCHVRILEEARALQALGHEVTVVTYHKGKDVPGLPIVRTAPTPWRSEYEVGSSRHKFVFDVLLGWKLLQVLAGAARRGRQFHVIHGHLHEGALIGCVCGRLFGVPVCFDFQGSLTDEMIMHGFISSGGMAHRLFKWIENGVTRLPAAVVTSTLHAAHTLRAALPAHIRVQALPDGVDPGGGAAAAPDPHMRAALRAEYGIGPQEIVVVYLGLLAQHQGIQNLIDAAVLLEKKNLPLRWLVMGYPEQKLWLERAVQAGISERMIFTGRVPYERMPQMLALGDVAVAPKLSLTEGSGKILNYMSLALPTVAFDTPAQREILGDLGVYAPLGDNGALAGHIAELASDPIRRAMLGAQLRARVYSQFSWRAGAQTLVEVYRSLLHRGGAA